MNTYIHNNNTILHVKENKAYKTHRNSLADYGVGAVANIIPNLEHVCARQHHCGKMEQKT